MTRVLTAALAGLPGAKAVRGSTMTGMAYVDLLFDDDADLDAARAEIAARVARLDARTATAPVRCPRTCASTSGPAASSTGWVFEYALTDPARLWSGLDLRRFQDDVLRPALAAIPGVAEVASVGGDLRRGARRRQTARAARGGPGVHGRGRRRCSRCLPPGTAWRAPRWPTCRRCRCRNAAPGVRVGDVALVRLTEDVQTGLADLAGVRAVGGIVVARRNADIASLVAAVKQTIARECRKLPHRAADPARLDSGAGRRRFTSPRLTIARTWPGACERRC